MTGAGGRRVRSLPRPPPARPARDAGLRLPARSHGRRPGRGARGGRGPNPGHSPGPHTRVVADAGKPGVSAGGRLTWRGQRAEDLAAAVMAAAAAAAARAGSDWRWLPGTGRWRPHVTHIRALRAGAGRGGRLFGSRAAGAGRGEARRAWSRGVPARILAPRAPSLTAAASPHPPPARPAWPQPSRRPAPTPRPPSAVKPQTSPHPTPPKVSASTQVPSPGDGLQHMEWEREIRSPGQYGWLGPCC